jgi:hypothetical protein
MVIKLIGVCIKYESIRGRDMVSSLHQKLTKIESIYGHKFKQYLYRL